MLRGIKPKPSLSPAAAILSLFLTKALLLAESDATVIYHVFAMFCYFFPLLGAIIADSWLGKF